MPAIISVIGLGQLGSAVVAALSKYDKRITIQAYDPATDRVTELRAAGFLHNSENELLTIIKNADLVIDCSPYRVVKNNLAFYTKNMRADSIYFCCAPNKQKLSLNFEVYQEQVPDFVGLVMTFNNEKIRSIFPKQIYTEQDFFKNASIGISVANTAKDTVIRKALDFTELLGAKGVLMDHYEADLTEARVYINPLLQAVVTFSSALESGWIDANRFSGIAFTQIAAFAGVESGKDLAEILIDQPDGAIRWLTASTENARRLEELIQNEDKNKLLGFFDSLSMKQEEFLKGYGFSTIKPTERESVSESILQKIMGIFQRRNE